MMTDYNDGNWHPWNGGECPVHPKSLVQVMVRDGIVSSERQPARAYEWDEDHTGTIVAFRVVKEHKEPRTDYNDGKWYGWNGGESPVLPKAFVDVIFRDGGKDDNIAELLDWRERGDDSIVAFRVVKNTKEPREFWVKQMTDFDLNGNVVSYSYMECDKKEGQFKVREVLDE